MLVDKRSINFIYFFQLGNLHKFGSNNCGQYWPQSGSISAEDIKVLHLQSQGFPDYAVHQFTLTRSDHPDQRVVYHFHLFSWLKLGVPRDPSIVLSFINKINNWHGGSNEPKVCVS